jgi:hypothetical protein
MKRAILAIAGTISGLVLLLGFKTHPAGRAAGGVTDTSTGTTTGPSVTSSAGSSSAGSSGTRTVQGSTIDTRWARFSSR